MTQSLETGGLFARAIAALKRKMMMRKAISFATIGVVNTFVDLGIFLLALQYLTGSLVVANVLAWTVAVSGSYVMNSFVTFAAESGRKLSGHAYLVFVASQILGLVANTATLVAAALVLPVVVAKLLAIGAGFLVNFSMSHFVVFRPQKAADDRR